MSYQLLIENERGELLELTNNRNYDIMSIEGTNPPTATINTVVIAGFDGSRFNSSRVEQRNIVIQLNVQQPCEANRIALYKFFAVKKPVRIWYRNGQRNVYIDGYVETFENNMWTDLQQPQISIICPSAFWRSASDTVARFSYSVALFEFPFSIPVGGIEFSRLEILSTVSVDVGEVDTGATFIMRVLNDGQNIVKNPRIYNATTGEYFGIHYDLEGGDLLTINTNIGEKSVKLTRNGITTSLLSYRTTGSSWLYCPAGLNEISFSADQHDELLDVTIVLTRKYAGV